MGGSNDSYTEPATTATTVVTNCEVYNGNVPNVQYVTLTIPEPDTYYNSPVVVVSPDTVNNNDTTAVDMNHTAPAQRKRKHSSDSDDSSDNGGSKSKYWRKGKDEEIAANDGIIETASNDLKTTEQDILVKEGVYKHFNSSLPSYGDLAFEVSFLQRTYQEHLDQLKTISRTQKKGAYAKKQAEVIKHLQKLLDSTKKKLSFITSLTN